ncbi:hypothetical protein HID58_088855 [Brassica napus]|uniref:Uncharacterized protein n=1 Tax=Brassica napus TaxID=3708 RepID=A0ABQ7XYQ3_BRANA|nr:hypothetical protein HID58_088855 [Brassica napus]
MRFRKLKNKDEDGVVENNEGLAQALLGSCNDCARQLQASSSGISPCLKDFDINLDAYNGYSKLYLSLMFALLYGLSFASFFATISHVTLYDGMFIWGMWKKATTATKDNFGDVHSRLMKKNYLSSGTSDPDQRFLLTFNASAS